MNIKTVVIRDLANSADGLYPYTFFTRYQVSPFELAKAIDSALTEGLIEEDEGRFKITAVGRQSMLVNPGCPANEDNRFSDIPIEFIGPKISKYSLYLPNISLLKDIEKMESKRN